jgi:hypothetical protein
MTEVVWHTDLEVVPANLTIFSQVRLSGTP